MEADNKSPDGLTLEDLRKFWECVESDTQSVGWRLGPDGLVWGRCMLVHIEAEPTTPTADAVEKWLRGD
jgi:hypothetical protein